uniref:Uncharacterized protein n=1 Tax=Zea mays TaxID=4577 RepID=C4J7D8_MAIZE|nr:unknown [Zea mays]
MPNSRVKLNKYPLHMIVVGLTPLSVDRIVLSP